MNDVGFQMRTEQQQHINTLTKRYLHLKKQIQNDCSTKHQRKEFEALKWVLNRIKEENKFDL